VLQNPQQSETLYNKSTPVTSPPQIYNKSNNCTNKSVTFHRVLQLVVGLQQFHN